MGDEYGNTPLIYAARKNDKSMMNYLLELGADVNAENQGWTALCEVARDENGDYEGIQLLIDRGAEVNHVVQQSKMQTPVELALKAQNEDTLKALIVNRCKLLRSLK